MNQNMKMLPGENRKITKWYNNGNGGDRVFTGRNDELRYETSVKSARAAAPVRTAGKKRLNQRFTRFMGIIDLVAVAIIITVLVISNMKAKSTELQRAEAENQYNILADECERIGHELEAYETYEVVASRAADHGFMDDNHLARVQLAITEAATETASR